MKVKRVSFKWEFTISEDLKELTIDLNGGNNCTIDLTHELAPYYISEKLAEILVFQYDVGTKTKIDPPDAQTILKAVQLTRQYKLGKCNLYY